MRLVAQCEDAASLGGLGLLLKLHVSGEDTPTLCLLHCSGLVAKRRSAAVTMGLRGIRGARSERALLTSGKQAVSTAQVGEIWRSVLAI